MEGVYTKASKSAKMAIIGPELIQLPPELLSKLPPWKTKKMWEALDFLPKKKWEPFSFFFSFAQQIFWKRTKESNSGGLGELFWKSERAFIFYRY